MPYKLKDPNQVLMWKTFLVEKIFSRNLTWIIFENQNRDKDLFIPFNAIGAAHEKGIIARIQTKLMFFLCFYIFLIFPLTRNMCSNDFNDYLG